MKKSLFELLKIEKQAQKFYGYLLPKSYFVQVVVQKLLDSLKRDNNDSDSNNISSVLNECILEEIKTLNNAMYQLSEQVNNVPRLFQEKYQECEAQQSVNDDEVVMVRLQPPPSDNVPDVDSSNGGGRLSNNQNPNSIEIIEID